MPAISIVDEDQITPELDLAFRETLVACFHENADYFAKQRGWHGSMPLYSVYMEDESRKVIAHMSVVDRVVLVGSAQVRVAGAQNVAVLPQCRGMGMSARIMNEAMAEAFRRAFDCGLLFCSAALTKLYESCGWLLLEDRQIIRVDKNGIEMPLPEGNVSMWHRLLEKTFPDGDIHLQGNDW